MARVADQPGDRIGEQLLGAEVLRHRYGCVPYVVDARALSPGIRVEEGTLRCLSVDALGQARP